MAVLLTCSEDWQIDAQGAPVCPGTAAVVEETAYQAWPGITYDQANQLIAAALFVLALAFIVRRVLRLLS
ncbi:hypothetical protein [Arhodomonas sp. SL1]|uniref:hypothetical protein n=1 Tax=Arhodomonas sp. SL1 TaxID=3425691 RepID=UPI003F884327